MIDTLNFKLHCSQFDRNKIVDILERKTTVKSQTDYGDHKSIVANYKNYKIILGDSYLTISGSLTKLHYGNNLQQLTFMQVQDLILHFEEFLEMSLNDAEITRIDLACNIEVDKPISQYLNLFTSPDGYKSRIYESETTYFESSKEKLIFYDKGKELQSKQDRIIIGNERKNILRYEISVKKDIASVLNWADAKLENLHNYHDYIAVLKRFISAYRSLPIHTEPLPSQLIYDSVTAFKNSLITEGIRSMGGVQALNAAIKQASMKKEVKHNIRKFINTLPPGQIISAELKNELDAKILAICKQEVYKASEWSD
jgi:hypothetical protein